MKNKDKQGKKESKTKKHGKMKSMSEISDKKYAHLSSIEKNQKPSRNTQQKINNYTEHPSEIKKTQNKKAFISKTIEIEKPKPIKAKETDRIDREKSERYRNGKQAKTSNTTFQDNRDDRGNRTERTYKKEKNKTSKNTISKKINYDNEEDESDYYFHHACLFVELKI